MDRTAEFEALTATRGSPRPKQFTPLDDTTSLVTKINKMKSHISKYGHDYLDTYGCLPGASIMTEERRNKLDQDVDEFIEICNEKIQILRSEIRLGTKSNQVIECREEVIKIVQRILNDFFSHYNQLRMTKIKRDFEKGMFDRIESATGNLDLKKDHESLSSDINLESIRDISSEVTKKENSIATQVSNSSFSFDECQHQSMIAAEHNTSISPDEIQMLALENSQIHDELMTFNDEVKLIGKKIVQISKLQELFTEKVMEQEVELNNLHETAIRSSENVREGNDLIRDAMMKNASTRVFILFYIITLGFTILFLDWYNP